MCTYGAEVNDDTFEAVVLVETGMKTPLVRYTLDEFVARHKEGLSTYHEEAPAPAGERHNGAGEGGERHNGAGGTGGGPDSPSGCGGGTCAARRDISSP